MAWAIYGFSAATSALDGNCTQGTLECAGIPKATRLTRLRAVATLPNHQIQRIKKPATKDRFFCIPRLKQPDAKRESEWSG
jgi:hypothetical protein